jgi:N,N-dimethylformamidase beta subunit-like protein
VRHHRNCPANIGPVVNPWLWVWPTLPGKGTQGLVAGFGASNQAWFELRLGETGAVELLLNGVICATARQPLDPREWYFVAVIVDMVLRRARLHVHRQRYTWPAPVAFDHEAEIGDGLSPNGESLSRLILAASVCAPTENGVPAARQVFNGKLAAPCMYLRCLSRDEIVGLANGRAPVDAAANWNFFREYGSVQLVDMGPSGWHGKTHNRPARLMVGPFWKGEMGPSERHDAIHFHEDDTTDVGWPESVALTVPDHWPSGVYALRLRAAEDEDHLPFFVLPPRGKATNPIAVLFPTLSYLAYANECVDPVETAPLNPLYDLTLRTEAFSYVEANALKSTYDSHIDRSGICFSAVRRPNFDFRPRARSRIVGAPRQFPADLYLVDWLEQMGFGFDAISDFDLHNEGANLLGQYRVVITGSHPEYWSGAMIEAQDNYLQGGGRLMYLGGDGFYWSTAVTNDEGGLIEVRRFSSCVSELLETPALPTRASEPGPGAGGISRPVFGTRQQPTSARPTRVGKRFPVLSGPSQPPQQAKMLRERVADGGGGQHRAVRFTVCDIPALCKVLDELSRKLDCTLVSPR